MYLMIMCSRSVKFSGITSPSRPPTLRNITSSNVELASQDAQHHERRAVVFKCLTYSTFDDVTYDVILPLGWAGSHFFLAENESHIYPNMCAKFGCGPTVVSKKGGGGTDRQTKKTAALYSRLLHPHVDVPYSLVVT